jgi:hypothetical protein
MTPVLRPARSKLLVPMGHVFGFCAPFAISVDVSANGANVKLASDNDGYESAAVGFCVNYLQNPLEMEVLRQYATVYRMRRPQEVFRLRGG